LLASFRVPFIPRLESLGFSGFLDKNKNISRLVDKNF